MSDSVFTTSFLDRVKETLDENCPEGTGECVTRTKLAELLDLDPKLRLESALGALVTSGKVPGYEVRKGPAGGIGRVGERRERKPSTPSVPELTDEFKGQLMAALETLCDSNGTPVARKLIAAHMGLPKSPPMISAALQLDEFSGFETKIGKGGGVRRVVEVVVDDNSDSNLGEDLAASMDSSDEDVAEAAV